MATQIRKIRIAFKNTANNNTEKYFIVIDT